MPFFSCTKVNLTDTQRDVCHVKGKKTTTLRATTTLWHRSESPKIIINPKKAKHFHTIMSAFGTKRYFTVSINEEGSSLQYWRPSYQHAFIHKMFSRHSYIFFLRPFSPLLLPVQQMFQSSVLFTVPPLSPLPFPMT